MSGTIVIPDALRAHVERYWGERGRQWARTLPEEIAARLATWSLQLGATFPGASTAYVAAVTRADGSEAVLKVAFPDIVGEADALTAYRGNGAVRCYADDPAKGALLVERCRPGTTLRALGDPQAIVATACSLMQRCWTAAPPPAVPTLADHCARLAGMDAQVVADLDLRHRTVEGHGRGLNADDQQLAAEGIALLHRLPSDTTTELLLHGDLHPGNILRATREPWLVIDPKPLRGDATYETIPLIIETPTSDGAPLDGRELITRVGTVAELLGCSPRRIASWGLARRIDWALFCYRNGEDKAAERPLAEARWFRSAALAFAND